MGAGVSTLSDSAVATLTESAESATRAGKQGRELISAVQHQLELLLTAEESTPEGGAATAVAGEAAEGEQAAEKEQTPPPATSSTVSAVEAAAAAEEEQTPPPATSSTVSAVETAAAAEEEPMPASVAKVPTAPASAAEEQEQPAPPEDQMLARARERFSSLLRQISHEEGFANFCVSVDGSSGSDVAFETVLSLMKSRDGLICLHAYDSTIVNPSLPDIYLPSALKEKYDLSLSSKLSRARWQLKWLDKKGMKTKSFLLKAVNDLIREREHTKSLKPSFFVCGFSGRKGREHAKEEQTLSVLAAGQFALPNIIVKIKPPEGPRTFVAAIKDAANNSAAPYDIAVRLLKPGDKLIVLMVYRESHYESTAFHEDESEAVIRKTRRSFEARIEEDGIKEAGSRFVAVIDEPQKTVAQLILSFVESECANFLLINPHLKSGAPGSACVELIEKCPCNIIVGNR
jgi:hypothetical protein